MIAKAELAAMPSHRAPAGVFDLEDGLSETRDEDIKRDKEMR